MVMGKMVLVCMLLMLEPCAAIADPQKDAFQVVEQFKKAFDASDVQGVVKLFAPDAIFLGTVSPKLATKTEDIEAYFHGIKTDVPRKVVFGKYSTIVLSDTAVVFAGLDQFSSTKEGKTIDFPARFTLVLTKGDQGWRISHFHSSARPGG